MTQLHGLNSMKTPAALLINSTSLSQTKANCVLQGLHSSMVITRVFGVHFSGSLSKDASSLSYDIRTKEHQLVSNMATLEAQLDAIARDLRKFRM